MNVKCDGIFKLRIEVLKNASFSIDRSCEFGEIKILRSLQQFEKANWQIVVTLSGVFHEININYTFYCFQDKHWVKQTKKIKLLWIHSI